MVVKHCFAIAVDFVKSRKRLIEILRRTKHRNAVRTVFDAGVERDGETVIFRVTGDGFLYNMVRIMAGTLIYIAEGKIENGAIPRIIESKNRLLAGKTAAPEGLYLNKVFYGQINK